MTRKIIKVEEILTPCPEGITRKVRITLDCGHATEPNPIYSYRVGDRYGLCFRCESNPECGGDDPLCDDCRAAIAASDAERKGR